MARDIAAGKTHDTHLAREPAQHRPFCKLCGRSLEAALAGAWVLPLRRGTWGNADRMTEGINGLLTVTIRQVAKRLLRHRRTSLSRPASFDQSIANQVCPRLAAILSNIPQSPTRDGRNASLSPQLLAPCFNEEQAQDLLLSSLFRIIGSFDHAATPSSLSFC